MKLLETENKLLKDHGKNRQKVIDAILVHNSSLIQTQNIFAQKNSGTRKTSDISISHTTGKKRSSK